MRSWSKSKQLARQEGYELDKEKVYKELVQVAQDYKDKQGGKKETALALGLLAFLLGLLVFLRTRITFFI